MAQVRERAIEMGIRPERFTAYDSGQGREVHLNGWRVYGGENINFNFWLVVTTQGQIVHMYAPYTEAGWGLMEHEATAEFVEFGPRSLNAHTTLENLRSSALAVLKSATAEGHPIDVSATPGVEALARPNAAGGLHPNVRRGFSRGLGLATSFALWGAMIGAVWGFFAGIVAFHGTNAGAPFTYLFNYAVGGVLWGGAIGFAIGFLREVART
jgi:hypothetical protein